MEATASALLYFGVPVSEGNSEAAQYIAQRQSEGRQHLQRSNAFGAIPRAAQENLLQVFEECRQPGWDGYGARAVDVQTYRLAYRLLEAFPIGLPAPCFGAEPDGHLTLEWHRSPRWTLSVSVSPEGDLHFAALFATSKIFGTEPFFGEIPRTILDLIGRVSGS
jgi:hypothetical protein